MTRNFLIASAYMAAALALCFYIVLAFIWITTAIVADTSGGPVYKALAQSIDDCRDFKCVTIVDKDSRE